jgi:glutamate-1-semialdehyde 2,1-aminomutase
VDATAEAGAPRSWTSDHWLPVARGGAQELLGIDADPTDRVLGGGLPAAAYGGRRELMARIAPAGDVYQAGTLSGNPIAVAAGLATLRRLDATAYIRLAATTERLAAGLKEAAADRPVQVSTVPGLLTVFFSAIVQIRRASAATLPPTVGLCRAMLDKGVYSPASQFEAWFPSLAHDDTRSRTEAATEAFASHSLDALALRRGAGG